ncbi:MAG: SpaH/EbpB family LPXTG-anchored major pilin [Eubacteriales bacterium]|nr:SpaH/EbpB family LPXTG-anchored major pilin [Eubacteriales bacterium]
MKKTKKFLALLLGLMMMLTMSVTAFADGEDQPAAEDAYKTAPHTITITNADPAKKHVYEAYQVFSGKYETDGSLSLLTWGSGVKGDALLTELKSGENTPANIKAAFANDENPAHVAKTLSDNQSDKAFVDAFAAIVGKHLDAVAATSKEEKSDYKLEVTGDGYYFVKDQDGSVTEKGESYTKYMLKVIQDETIEAKDDHLTVEKNIIEGEGENEKKVKDNAVAIGDLIKYEVSAPMPEMDGYIKYFFQMNDTMQKGLEFQNIESIKIIDKDGEELKTLAEDTDYTETNTVENDITKLQITYKNFIQYKGEAYKGAHLVVRYIAKLTEKAEIVKSNDNTVSYKYSNKPDYDGEGDPDNPDYPGPQGETPNDEVHTWVTKLQLLKTGDNGTVEALEGAEFKLSGDDLNVVLKKGTEFVENENGTYYELKNGSFTTTPPTSDTEDQYKDKDKKFEKKEYNNVKTEVGDSKEVTLTTGADGIISFTGLKPGTYKLEETKAPNGYNKAPDIEFEIKWTKENGFSVENKTDDSHVEYDAANFTFKVTVDDKSGSTLPSTGGMGTKIFYVLGSLLAIGAAVMLISKRRVSVK